MKNHMIGPSLIIQFIAAFNNDKVIFFSNSFISIIVAYTCIYISHFFFKNTIQLLAFYHTQCAPQYMEFVHLRYNGAIYEIRVRRHKEKVYLADGLENFRKDLKIYESTTINFFACDHHCVFDIHFIPPLERQNCGSQRHSSRKHI